MANGIRITLNVEGDLEDAQRRLARFPGKLESATANAMNKTLRFLRRSGLKIAKETYTARKRVMNSDVGIRRASRTNLVGTLTFRSAKGISLINFKHRPNNLPRWKGKAIRERRPFEGISVQILKNGQMKPRDKNGMKSFLVKNRGGGMQIFSRIRHGRHGERTVLYGPGPVRALQRRGVKEKLEREGRDFFKEDLNKQVERILARMSS